MATSGSVDFSMTRDEIISDAYYGLGIYRVGDTISTNDKNYAARILNRMIKAWENDGVHVWTKVEGALFLTDGKSKYTLSASTTDKVGQDPVQMSLTADCTGTTVTVGSTVGVTASDNIGIALDANTIHWTTVASVDSSTQITIASGVSSTASSGNAVFTYTTALGRPLFLLGARLQMKSGIEREVDIAGHTEFMQMSIKQQEGPVTMIYYQPRVSDGIMYVYMTPNDVNECIRFTCARSIQDFDSSSDTPDLPQECYDALVLNLSVRLAPSKGKNLMKTNPELIQEALRAYNALQLYDTGSGQVNIIPNDRYDE